MTPQDQTLSGGSYDFVWTGAHNVYKFNDKQAYDTCDFTKAVLVGAVSPVVIRESSEFVGTVYYGCSTSTSNTCTCSNGVAVTGTACTSNGASICATCDSESYKTGSSCTTCRSACGTGTKETTACSSAANRVCTTIVEDSTTTLTWKIPMKPQDQPLSV